MGWTKLHSAVIRLCASNGYAKGCLFALKWYDIPEDALVIIERGIKELDIMYEEAIKLVNEHLDSNE